MRLVCGSRFGAAPLRRAAPRPLDPPANETQIAYCLAAFHAEIADSIGEGDALRWSERAGRGGAVESAVAAVAAFARVELSAPERLYRLVGAAIEGGRIPLIVQADTPTLLSLTLYADPKLVSIALGLLRMQFREKEILLGALGEIQWIVSEVDRAVFRTLAAILPELHLRVERSEMWLDAPTPTQARARACNGRVNPVADSVARAQEASDVCYMIGVRTGAF